MHTVYMAQKRRAPTQKTRPSFRRTFIEQWRDYRGLTQVALAARVEEKIGEFSRASLSRIENGKQPYSQPILEALAEALQTDPASLLMRNPQDPEAIWTIWDQAKPGERKLIEELAQTVRKTGT